MTFQDMQASVFDDLDYRSEPDAAVRQRIQRWLNQAHQELLRTPGLRNLRNGSVSFESVANQMNYAVPQLFEVIDGITQPDNSLRLVARDQNWVRSVDPGNNSFGTPEAYIPVGLSPVGVQPDETGLWIVSSDASDVGSVVVQGTRANGDAQPSVTTVLNGTTRVAVGTLTDYVTVTRFMLAAVAAGNVSLYDAATLGNELARIPVGLTSVQYQVVRLWPTGGSVLTYIVDGQRLVPAMVDPTDVPWVPVSYHDAMTTFARMREYKRTGDAQRFSIENGSWEKTMAQLRSVSNFPPDWTPIPGRLPEGGLGWSNLGGNYPPDGWGW